MSAGQRKLSNFFNPWRQCGDDRLPLKAFLRGLIRKFLIATAIVLAAAASASAKLHVSLKIEVSNEKANRELQEAMEARINSTDRYAISRNVLETDLLIAVNCLVLERGPVVCDSNVTYYPYKDSALFTEIEGAESMAGAGLDNTSYVTTSLMNHFINGTTDSILAERKSFLRGAIRDLCASEPTECKTARP
jgi:hypothetical protein